MTYLVWIAEHYILVAALAAAVAIVLKFEHSLPKKIKSFLFIADICLIVSSLSLGALKDHLDTVWQEEIVQRVAKAEKATQPRKLTDAQRNFLSAIIKGIPKCSIRIAYTSSDQEASSFGADFRKFFIDAGYKVELFTPNVFYGCPPGLTFSVHDPHNTPLIAPVLQKSFVQAKIDANWRQNLTVPLDELWIDIGQKPIINTAEQDAAANP